MTEKNIALLQYISKKLGGVSYYFAFKYLYFAEQKHLVRYGSLIVQDNYCHLPFGPVPTSIYNQLKDLKANKAGKFLTVSKNLLKGITIEEETLLIPLADPDMDLISESELECLDESIEENKKLSFESIKNKSHGEAWSSTTNGACIPIDKIALEAGANPEMIKYINFVLGNQSRLPK